MKITAGQSLAYLAARDAAVRSMRKEGRSTLAVEDVREAKRVFKFMRVMEKEACYE